MGAYLFLRAGTGRGPITYANELAQTFDWSRPTAGKVIKALIERGLAAKVEIRQSNGRIGSVGYRALPRVLWQKPLSKNQGTVHQGTVFHWLHGRWQSRSYRCADLGSHRALPARRHQRREGRAGRGYWALADA